MKTSDVVKILSILVIAVGAADLMLGNTEHAVLPDFLGNHLDQQSDVVLIGVGALAWWMS